MNFLKVVSLSSLNVGYHRRRIVLPHRTVLTSKATVAEKVAVHFFIYIEFQNYGFNIERSYKVSLIFNWDGYISNSSEK